MPISLFYQKRIMKHTISLFIWTVCILLLPLEFIHAENNPTELLKKLQSLPGITDIKPLESNAYPEKYVLFIEQLLDPKHPEAGSFKQRIILGHIGFDRPTILVTEGYAATYALAPRYQEELSKRLNANLVFVEYRYFDASMPDPCNWDYLTVENSLYDLHHVTTTFKQLYPQKWISTGISKGGQTTMFYRAYFPDDVDFSVPYVAPLNKSLEDGRHEPFIAETVSTAQNREKVKEFQLEVLKRKAELLPMFERYCLNKGYTFRVPITEIYDFNVLEYSFALWQWGTSVTKIPSPKADNQTIFNHFIAICEPDYFSEQSPYPSFNVQAAKELGYYGYDTEPFKKWLSISTAHGYLNRAMLPDELRDNVELQPEIYHKVYNFLRDNDPKIIFIYGEIDPWTAVRVPAFEGKQNEQIYIQPRGSHLSRISKMPEKIKNRYLELIHAWLMQLFFRKVFTANSLSSYNFLPFIPKLIQKRPTFSTGIFGQTSFSSVLCHITIIQYYYMNLCVF